MYEATRHNVGWWLLDHLADAWGFEKYRATGVSRVADGEVDGLAVRLLKPWTFMNRSGLAMADLGTAQGFDVGRDLLVVVDDVALDVGRIRFRPGGSAGGHNGLKSIEAALGTRDYPRLRIGVGKPPPGHDLAAWVLSPLPPEEEQRILDLLPLLTEAVEVWARDGIEAAMSRFNR